MAKVERRIVGARVAPLFPARGPVRILLIGEAPGPRGADRSSIPFWGDRAGKLVYRALSDEKLAQVPERAWDAWDGARLIELGLVPRVSGVALTNALDHCPSSDGRSFRAPTDRELRDPQNLARLAGEIARAEARAGDRLTLIAFGMRARWLLPLLHTSAKIDVQILPHPSAQGLLQAAPDRGRGLKLVDLAAAWERELRRLLRVASDGK
jgi:hypothetical protein